MRKHEKFIIVALISCIFLSGCGHSRNAVAKVITSPADGTYHYGIVYDDQSYEETSVFTPDHSIVYTADPSDFTALIDNGKLTVKLKNTKITNEEGNIVQPDDLILLMMEWLADNSSHEISQARFIIDADHYYMYVTYNVNTWIPCVLFQYIDKKGQCEKLCEWDNEEFIGISVCEDS